MLSGAGGSLYLPIVVLCPVLLPLVRLIAGAFPDERMKKVRGDAGSKDLYLFCSKHAYEDQCIA